MFRLLLIGLVLGVISAARAEAPAASKFCTGLDETSARTSTECVRWYFACRLVFPQGPAKPPFDRVPVETRYQISMSAILRIAEMSCDHFSYVEAWAAMQAKSFPRQTPGTP